MRAKMLPSLLLGVMAPSLFAQPEDAQLRRELQDFYTRVDRLLAAGKDTALLKLYHPGFVNVDRQGNRSTLSGVKTQFAAMRANVRGAKTKTVVKHVRRQGSDEAVAWAEMTFTGTVKRGNRWVPTKSTTRFAETLRRTPSGGWRAYYSQELPTDEPWSFQTGG